MRAASTKSSLVKMFKEETEVMTSGFHRQGDWKTTVVVDAMYAFLLYIVGPSRKMRHLETLLIATMDRIVI